MVAHRPCVIIGNWKMHKNIEEALSFVKTFMECFQPNENQMLGLAVPYTVIYPLVQEIKGSSLLIGAQNMNDASEGAFTGEIAGSMLKDAGAQFVLLGHSERRHLYGEDDALINRKLKKAVEVGLKPILCVGENKIEYENQQTDAVVERQLVEGLKGLRPEQLSDLTVAYEPIWAISNGHSATQKLLRKCNIFVVRCWETF